MLQPAVALTDSGSDLVQAAGDARASIGGAGARTDADNVACFDLAGDELDEAAAEMVDVLDGFLNDIAVANCLRIEVLPDPLD
eukprot:6455860-Alexandrium_andersonii.AAC.1